MGGASKSPKTTLICSLTDDKVCSGSTSTLIIGTSVGSTSVRSGHANFFIFREKTTPYVRCLGF